MKKTLLLSVPHTGTVFTRNYIVDVLDIPHCRNLGAFIVKDVSRMHVNLHTVEANYIGNGTQLNRDILEYAEENCNVIIPIRDPIENAISCLGRGHNTLHYCIGNWRAMLLEYPRFKNVFWIDVWTAEENRRNMMLKLNEFLDMEPEKEKFDNFVDQWKKVNTRSDEQMIKGDRRIPFHDVSELQFAVDWYNEKKAELNELYSPLPTD